MNFFTSQCDFSLLCPFCKYNSVYQTVELFGSESIQKNNKVQLIMLLYRCKCIYEILAKYLAHAYVP